jgi:hypothetical protein
MHEKDCTGISQGRKSVVQKSVLRSTDTGALTVRAEIKATAAVETKRSVTQGLHRALCLTLVRLVPPRKAQIGDGKHGEDDEKPPKDFVLGLTGRL